MLSQVEAFRPQPGTSLSMTRRIGSSFPFNWHHHTAFELTLFEKGSGRQFVGDNIRDYQQGNFTLIGSNLPHTWASYDAPHPTSYEHRAAVAQFQPADFPQWPELLPISHLLERAASGVMFGPEAHQARKEFSAAIELDELERWLKLLDILSQLSKLPTTPLASPGWMKQQLNTRQSKHAQSRDTRIDAVYQYVEQHLHRSVPQAEVAKLLRMVPAAFARFFKRRTGLTYSTYVQELRIGQACRRLSESDMSITNIAFETGFQSIPHFNRVFKKIRGQSPRDWRKNHCYSASKANNKPNIDT